MTEFTGVRGFDSTPIILDRLEAVGRKHAAVQHWAIFRNLTRADVERAYPSLINNECRWVRGEITNNGILRASDNAFSVRVGFSDAPADLFVSDMLHCQNPPAVDVSHLMPLLLSGPSG